MIKGLLEKYPTSFDVNGVDGNGYTAFNLALFSDREDVALSLMEHPNLDVNRLVRGIEERHEI